MEEKASYHLDSKNDGPLASSGGELEEETSFSTPDVFQASKGFVNPIYDYAGASSRIRKDEDDERNGKETKRQCRNSKAKVFR